MIIKLYLKYEEKLPGYWVFNSNPLRGKECELDLLFMSLNVFCDSILVNKFNHTVVIMQHFVGDDERDDFVVELNRENYETIVAMWNKIRPLKPKYFILSWDDQNNKINLTYANELSFKDLQYLEQNKLSKLHN